jgi:hypothetical protein
MTFNECSACCGERRMRGKERGRKRGEEEDITVFSRVPPHFICSRYLIATPPVGKS